MRRKIVLKIRGGKEKSPAIGRRFFMRSSSQHLAGLRFSLPERDGCGCSSSGASVRRLDQMRFWFDGDWDWDKRVSVGMRPGQGRLGASRSSYRQLFFGISGQQDTSMPSSSEIQLSWSPSSPRMIEIYRWKIERVSHFSPVGDIINAVSRVPK